MTMTELCQELKNYFVRSDEDIHHGQYSISGGSISPADFLIDGQYFRIVGSVLNDGVYEYPTDALIDETFTGAIWAMAIPPDVIALASEIDSWINDNANVLNSPYTSESFGGYSYTKASASYGAGSYSWQNHFASRLNKWRKIHV